MNNEVLVIEKHDLEHFAKLEQLAKITQQVSSNRNAPNTLNGYASDWDDFESWCNEHRFQSLPASPNVVASYLADRAMNAWVGPSGRLKKPMAKSPLKLNTLLHRVWGIRFKHVENGYPFNAKCKEIESILDSLRRNNTAKEIRKDPLLINDIRKMSEDLQHNIKDKASNPKKALSAIRDRAILLIGFSSAMRRSEIASLTMENLKFIEEGLEIHIMQSKTGAREIVITYGSNPLTCPIRALKVWLNEASIVQGPLFRAISRYGKIGEQALSGHAVALIVKRNGHVQSRIEEAKQRGEYVPSFGGHSLRAGFVTTAAMQDVPEDLIMAQTGHKKSDTVKKYIRRANKWHENAVMRLGL